MKHATSAVATGFATGGPHRRVLVVDGSARALLLGRIHYLQAMADAGHEVMACAPQDTCMHDVQLADLPGTGSRLESVGVRYVPIRMDRQSKNPIRDIGTFTQLCRLVRQFHPDIVLTYAMKSSIYGSLAAKLSGIGERYSEITGLGYLFGAGSGLSRIVQTLARRMLRAALSGSTMVFFQNPDDRDEFAARRILPPTAPTMVVGGSGVDVEDFVPVPFPAPPTVFLLIGRVQYDKGVAEYAESAKMLRAQHPEARFQLLGPLDDHPSAIPRQVLQQWTREGAIEFLGGTTDVKPFIAAAHVYVLPSYREGTPRSALEAMAMGRPVITTDAPGCREVVRDGDNGFLVPVRNAPALAAAMQRFIDDSGLIPRMGRCSRVLVEEKFDTRRVVKSKLNAMGLSR